MSMDLADQKFLEFGNDKHQKNERQGANCVIYTRVSSKEQMDNASLSAQKRHCAEFAERRNLNVLGRFGGTYESAKSDERKEFGRMMGFVKRNRSVSFIVVYKYDRFSRTGPNASYLSSQLKKNGIVVLSVTQEVDPTTSMGEFQENLYYMFGQFENMIRRDNMMTGMAERISEGYWPLSPPLGYTNLNKGQKSNKHEIVVNEDGKQLRKAWRWKIKQGLANTEIVERLRCAGVRINERKLSDTFRNPFYCGVIVCNFLPGKAIKGKHEAMVSKEDFFKVIEILKGKFQKGKHSTEVSAQLPLKRFMRCNECGEPYTGYLQKQKNLYYYRCRKKGCCQNRSRKKIHLAFAEHLKRYELHPNSMEHVRKMMLYVFGKFNQNMVEEASSYQKELGEVDKKIEQLEERFIIGEVAKELFDKYNSRFQDDKKKILEKLDKCKVESSNLEKAVNWVVDSSGNLSEVWASSNADQQEVLQELVFPEGISYDRENEVFLTERVNCLYLPIPELAGTSENKKTGSKGNIPFDPVKSGWQDSNLRPPAPKAGAIPGYATPRKKNFVVLLKSVADFQKDGKGKISLNLEIILK